MAAVPSWPWKRDRPAIVPLPTRSPPGANERNYPFRRHGRGLRINVTGTPTKMSPSDARMLKPAANALVASALRTLDPERDGVAALIAAMCDGLGPSFAAAVETIRVARGRVIVTGM